MPRGALRWKMLGTIQSAHKCTYQSAPTLVHPAHHFIHCVVKGKAKFVLRCGFKSGLFILEVEPPGVHFITDKTEDVPEIFREHSIGDAVRKMVKRNEGLRSGEGHFCAGRLG